MAVIGTSTTTYASKGFDSNGRQNRLRSHGSKRGTLVERSSSTAVDLATEDLQLTDSSQLGLSGSE